MEKISFVKLLPGKKLILYNWYSSSYFTTFKRDFSRKEYSKISINGGTCKISLKGNSKNFAPGMRGMSPRNFGRLNSILFTMAFNIRPRRSIQLNRFTVREKEIRDDLRACIPAERTLLNGRIYFYEGSSCYPRNPDIVNSSRNLCLVTD